MAFVPNSRTAANVASAATATTARSVFSRCALWRCPLGNLADLGRIVALRPQQGNQLGVIPVGNRWGARHDPRVIALVAADDRPLVVGRHIEDAVICFDRPHEAHAPDGIRLLVVYESARIVTTGISVEASRAESKCRIDGAAFWVGDGKPAIAMSLRIGRMDNFWFVLRHEIEHALNGDGKDGAFVLDNDLDQAPNVSEQEQRANEAASDFCVARAELTDFMKRKGPLFTDVNIRQFAHTNGLHSGLVAGQLRMQLSKGPLGADAWKRFTSHLAKIRHAVISSALVDGFGSSPQIAP